LIRESTEKALAPDWIAGASQASPGNDGHPISLAMPSMRAWSCQIPQVEPAELGQHRRDDGRGLAHLERAEADLLQHLGLSASWLDP
jgi:hypothetical protein